MTSIKSKIVIGLIKNRHFFKGKLKPEVIDESFSVEKFREDINKVSNRMKLPKNVRAESLRINGIYAEWIVPENPPEEKVLMYIHGGGFISGSCHTHRGHVAKLANSCGVKSLVFDYRLAPEHPFPAALDDCVEVYRWLLGNGYKSENIVIGGESAGATLTMSLLLALKKHKINLPKAAFSISPVTDLRCLTPSFLYNAKNDVAPENSWKVWTEMYIGTHDPTNPLLSPQFGDFEGVPPLFICVGTHEIHLDDCENLATLAQKHGVKVTLRKWEKMIHAFPLLAPLFPEAKMALKEISDFVKEQLKYKNVP